MIFLFVIGAALWLAGRRFSRRANVIYILTVTEDGDPASESIDTFPQEWA